MTLRHALLSVYAVLASVVVLALADGHLLRGGLIFVGVVAPLAVIALWERTR
jgi:hypothetical protein